MVASSKIDYSLLELFKTELEQYTRVLDSGIVDLEQEQTPKKIEPLMRAAHSIKGAARIVGLDIAVTLAHSMEDLFTAAQKGKLAISPEVADLLLEGNDIYTKLLDCEIEQIPDSLMQLSSRIDELSKLMDNALNNNSPKLNGHSKPIPKKENIQPQVPARKKPEKVPLNVDESLFELFLNEVSSLSNEFKNFIENYSDDKLNQMMRVAHSIYGATRIIGFEMAIKFSKSLEDYLNAAINKEFSVNQNILSFLSDCNKIFLELKAENPSDLVDYWLSKFELIEEYTEKLLKIPSDDLEIVEETKIESAEIEEISNFPKDETKADTPTAKLNVQPVLEEELISRQVDKIEERFVRVLSDNLNKLLGFAGEALVQARSIKPFSKELQQIKQEILELNSNKESVFLALQNIDIDDEIKLDFQAATYTMNNILDMLVNHIDNFESFSMRMESVAERLYQEAVNTRMKPFSEGLHGFPRLVRDISKKLNKDVELEIKGEYTRVDRDILEKLEAPLNHLIRNAIDHGIESPDERVKSGKTPKGKIILEARHSSGMLLIMLKDNGKGISPEYLRKKIVEKGFTTVEMAANMSKAELFEFLFLPGFSTAASVTEISGRGVGLDVVFSMVHQVGGTVRCESEPGISTSFILQLPLTLSILRSVLIEIDKEPYALPMSRVEQIIKIKNSDIFTVEEKDYCIVNNENIGIIDSYQVFGFNQLVRKNEDHILIIISDRLNKFGLIVDRLIAQPDLVVMPLDKRLGRIPVISAGAVLENGTPALIIDVDDLVRTIDMILSKGDLLKIEIDKTEKNIKRKKVLIVDDSLTVREVEKKLLENKKYLVVTAVDGIDGWNKLHIEPFDLIISDVDMPRMNGIDLVKRIKSDSKLKDIPVMIVSYKDRAEDKIKGLNAGANYYLTKSSFHDDSLISAVVDLIGTAE